MTKQPQKSSSLRLNSVHFLRYNVQIVVPGTGGTQPMVECPQCLGLQLLNFVSYCHPYPLLHPPNTTTPLMARYLLIKIWLPANSIHSKFVYFKGMYPRCEQISHSVYTKPTNFNLTTTCFTLSSQK